jgi:hypothetical protein
MSSGGSPGGPAGGGIAANASALISPEGRNVEMGNGLCESWPARGRSGKTLDAKLLIFVGKISNEHVWSTSPDIKTAEQRFQGLEGSQLTDVCIYFYALSENATYKVARRNWGEGRDGPKTYFLELLTKRHRQNMVRKNPKGRVRYKKLFGRGGYQADIVGKMIGVQWVGPGADFEGHDMVSGGTRMAAIGDCCVELLDARNAFVESVLDVGITPVIDLDPNTPDDVIEMFKLYGNQNFGSCGYNPCEMMDELPGTLVEWEGYKEQHSVKVVD